MSLDTNSHNDGTVDARPDPRLLTNLPDILSALSSIQSEEAELSNSLTDLLSDRAPIVSSLSRLRSVVPQLNDLNEDALLLSEKVVTTAQTAERVGGRVRSLDEEMRRIREAGDRVGQVIELKSSLAELQASIESHDWESASRHCARVMALPLDVISGPFAEHVVPTSDNHLPPVQTLQAVREQLLSVFQENFERASSSRDSAATSRFFKLFPAIGWEREGLQAYALFIVDLVRVRAPASAKTSSPLYYTTALTALFESIAMIVDQHQPVVEKYYGVGKMISVVERLLDECDRVVKGLIEGWEEERSMKHKLSDTSNNPPIPMFNTTIRRQTSAMSPDEEGIDPREIDKVLVEAASMAGRWNLFRKFLCESMTEDSSSESTEAPVETPTLSLDSTKSHHLFEDLLTTYYIPMEMWYTRTIMDKAHRLSNPDLTQSPVVTTTPDDVFYILKIVLLRLISTGSYTAVERTLQQLREVMERDYSGVIKKKLDDVYRAAGTSGQSRGEKVEKENRLAFITLLNDLDISASHLERLTRDLVTGPTIGQHFSEQQQPLVKDQITSFSSSSAKIGATLRVGLEQLFNQLLRPKLRNLVPEIYKDISYVLDDDTYAAAEYQNVVRKRFIKTWETCMDGYKDAFTDRNYRMFFGLALDVLLKPWEKFMMGFKFTELGAIRFDRDLRSITTYLSSQTAFGDAREKFVRLQQMSTLLNLDNEEDVDEFYNGSGISWKLTAQEARAIVSLKV
ncbi:COG4 transport protein-domain-containing protein [Desarmillaria tabescens]|uniref:Conserved oligomeric Golgi complex subunit 4 n=1 Tax=Armillaria tabescens TaxID=1929756 RepID=A0AA39JE89_ARMTA|nr:COG4 transport protein-domain-containing protein [Desarmillaria tabescens]KAK0441157.1 COG4 transport protein-domain-containing protein [Desarmillaria tabescens]